MSSKSLNLKLSPIKNSKTKDSNQLTKSKKKSKSLEEPDYCLRYDEIC